jgi:hypothetical protein
MPVAFAKGMTPKRNTRISAHLAVVFCYFGAPQPAAAAVDGRHNKAGITVTVYLTPQTIARRRPARPFR